MDDKEPELPLAPDADAKLFGNDEPKLEPIEIELEEQPAEPEPLQEGGQPEPPQQEAEAPKPKKRNRVSAEQRFGQMRAEIGERDRQIAEMQRRMAEMEEQARGLAQRNVEADAAAFDTHDARWHSEANAAKEALRVAHEKMAAGDPNGAALVADATGRVAAAASEMQAINAFKAQHPHAFNADGTRKAQQAQPRPVQQPAQQVVQQPQEQMNMPEDVAEWVDNNPWIRKGSDEFDPEMAQAATNYTQMLDIRYKRAGRADEIGTKAYFNELDAELARTFPEAYEDQPAPPRQEKRSPTMNRPNGAAPAAATSRQASATDAPAQANGTKVRMSADDQDMALKMGYVYDHDHPKAGKRMSEQDALRNHAKYMAEVQKKDRALGRG